MGSALAVGPGAAGFWLLGPSADTAGDADDIGYGRPGSVVDVFAPSAGVRRTGGRRSGPAPVWVPEPT